jgi:hypothetical protein
VGAKLRTSELLIALGSLVLLGTTLLPYFSLPSIAELATRATGAQIVGGGRDSALDLNVWDLPIVRWWVYLTALLGICMVAAAVFSETPGKATFLLTPITVFSLFSTIGLLFRVFDAPRPGAEAQPGLFIALLAAAGVFAACGWALRDEGVPDGFRKPPAPELIEVE